MVQGDEKKYIFNEYKHKKKYLYLMRRNAFKNDIEIISYCIMDNHVHILVFCPILERLSKFMLEINTAYALYFNKKREKVGHVFRERYRSESIYTKDHLINCIKYIHYNPVKAKICAKCSQYIFSSYNEFQKDSYKMKDICGISEVDVKNILNETCTNTNFIEDEYSKEDVKDALNEIIKETPAIKGDTHMIGLIYLQLHKRCKTNDIEIADALGISRTSLYRALKKEKIK